MTNGGVRKMRKRQREREREKGGRGAVGEVEGERRSEREVRKQDGWVCPHLNNSSFIRSLHHHCGFMLRTRVTNHSQPQARR